MKAADWIDRVKRQRGWDSDYRAAKELGLSKNLVSMYRTRTPTMDDETAVTVAKALEIEPELIILDQVAERSKNLEAKAAIARVLQRIGGVVTAFLVACGLWTPPPADAGPAVFDITPVTSSASAMNIVSTWLRSLAARIRDFLAWPLPADVLSMAAPCPSTCSARCP